jgi:hypothetical protein
VGDLVLSDTSSAGKFKDDPLKLTVLQVFAQGASAAESRLLKGVDVHRFDSRWERLARQLGLSKAESDWSRSFKKPKQPSRIERDVCVQTVAISIRVSRNKPVPFTSELFEAPVYVFEGPRVSRELAAKLVLVVDAGFVDELVFDLRPCMFEDAAHLYLESLGPK